MRFVDFAVSSGVRAGVGAVLLAGLAGCASLGDSLKSVLEPSPSAPVPVAPTPTPAAPPAAAPSPAAGAASAPAVASAASAPGPVVESGPPVSPAVQRAFDEARRALQAGRVQDAERGFKALTLSNPELGGPHANLGLIYRNAGKTAEAVAELERAVRMSPHQPLFFNQLGIAHRQHGQFAKAREAYEKAIALDANYAAPHLNLGILHDLYLWDGKRALELYDRYLALSPGGDSTVVKWVADLKNRKPQHAMLVRKEKE